MRRLTLIGFFLVLIINPLLAQQDEVWFLPNRGQWDSRILYNVGLTNGNFFVGKDQFTFALNDLSDVYHSAHEGANVDQVKNQTIHSHFINSKWEGEVIESDSSSFYNNYFLGQDQSRWKSKVYAYKAIELIDFYPGIDLIMNTTPEYIKYSFRVAPGVDPSVIQIFYEGMTKLNVSNDQIEIQTRFGSIYENDLRSWNQDESGRKTPVASQFRVNQDTVTFVLPEGYDSTKTLIIDPSLTFSTFTGSTSDNWGFTAAPDDDGNLIAGGIVFGTGYPVTTGSYDHSFNGGDGSVLTSYQIDIGISKFSSDGTNLLYSTYLGGNGNETPNSIITDSQGNLYILGISSSTNFPLSTGAFQTQNNGGPSTTQIAIAFFGTDIIISKLSADGTSLLGSTYMGGAENDGMNISSLNYNYGDVFRGEIILDHNGDVVFTSSTKSSDFPIINGSNTTLGGNQDGVVVKMTPDLSTVIWSTYLGGGSDDSGFSIQTSSSNSLYVTGGTQSTNLPFSGGYKTSFQGGSADGYVAELDGTTSAVLSGTYIGTNSYDQSFFVQLDQSDQVYVYGQTLGNMLVSSGVYSNPNSGQFIQQYSTDLSTLNWSTRVGGHNGVVEISPTAFLVSNCNEIYYTGWGGMVNSSNSQATGSTTNGFITTSDAFESNTNGNNFYIGVLSENATALNYGTFMGGVNSSYNHVDGGTSRFDKKGSIYHAVCGACGGNSNGFTTTPGAYSETNNSSNCNLAAWKFDLGAIHSSLSAPEPFICLPDSAYFQNNSQNGDEYFWDFGDGSTSTDFEPNHYYASPGTYDVMLVVVDGEGCFESDTSYLSIEVSDFNGSIVQPSAPICPGDTFQLEASGGTDYLWSPGNVLDDPTSATPKAVVDSTTVFTVVVSNLCGVDTLSLTLQVHTPSSDASDDVSICKGDTVQIWASGGGSYSWSAPDSEAIIGSDNTSTISVAPDQSMNFTADITTINGCQREEEVFVQVYQDVPHPILEDTIHLCKGDIVNVTATGAPSITWTPNQDINTTSGPQVTISAEQTIWYYVDFTNPCGTVRDSLLIKVDEVFPEAGNDTIVCPEEEVLLWANGGIKYNWTPPEDVYHPHDSVTLARPKKPTLYIVMITDKYGCSAFDTVHINHFPQPYVGVIPEYYGFKGDEIQLSAKGSDPNGIYTWIPGEFLSCVNCPNPIATPPEAMTYTVLFEDTNGCEVKEKVRIHFDPLIYVPNTFTPDGRGNNEMFRVEGGNIQGFKLLIFNRWGEKVFESNNIKEGWDGTYKGLNCPDGTYVWKLSYQDYGSVWHDRVGHINLLR